MFAVYRHFHLSLVNRPPRCLRLTYALNLLKKKKRRGVKASITRLGSHLKQLESRVEEPTTRDHAQLLATKLDTLDTEFKIRHFSLTNLIDDDMTLGKEQETFYQHDDDITTFAVRIQQLVTMS